jgi:hypothetical protein
MVLAFGALGPLVVAAAALSRGVLVAAAGVVVVLAILLVFVMVLRGSGNSSRHKASGLDYDAQQGPLGQPHAPTNEPGAGGAPWAGSPMGQMGQMGQMGGMGQMDDQFDPMGQGRRPAMPPQQQGQGWGAPFGASPAPQANPNAAPWGAPDPAADRWGDQMTPAGDMGGQMGGQMGGANDWGAAPSQSRGPANPWDAPAPTGGASAWNGANAGSTIPPTRPGGGNPWDAQPQPPAWDAPAAPSQPQWNAPAPAGPSQPQWNAPAPSAMSQPQWNAPAPAGPSQPQWNGQPDGGMAAGMAPGMMRPTAPRGPSGYGVPRLTERKPDGSGREFDLSKDRLTIGRHRESDVFLEDLAVSRLHTTISHDPSGRYILRDENSANGTYVNGQRVTSDYLLQDGDEVQVGQTTLVFQR